MGDKIAEYVNTICQQIRWKKARGRVFDEMTAHITDARDAYIAQGLDEAAATEQAITDTGDAAILGASFDRVHRPKPQWGMIAAVAGFLIIGIVADFLLLNGIVSFNRRLEFTVIGFVIMLAVYFVDFTILGKYLWVIVSAFIAFVAFLAWISVDIGFARGQALSLIFPLMLAICIFALRNAGIKGIVISGVVYGVFCIFGLMLFFASFLHFAVVGMAILLVVIWRNWFGISNLLKIGATLATLTPFVILAFWHMVFTNSLRSASRVAAAFNPHLDPQGWGFSALQARRVLSGAALFGQGAGEEIARTTFLPDARNNFFLTNIAYNYGLIPFIAIILALAAFIVVGFIRCFKQKSDLGFLVSFAVVATFTMQAVTYIAFNLGITLTLMTLPLISPGNSAMVVNLALLGFMLSVFRTGDAAPRHKPPQPYSSPQAQ